MKKLRTSVRTRKSNGVANEAAATTLSSKLDERLAKLLDERAKGQQIIAGLVQQLEETRQQVLRIDGAIRVLEELSAEEPAE